MRASQARAPLKSNGCKHIAETEFCICAAEPPKLTGQSNHVIGINCFDFRIENFVDLLCSY